MGFLSYGPGVRTTTLVLVVTCYLTVTKAAVAARIQLYANGTITKGSQACTTVDGEGQAVFSVQLPPGMRREDRVVPEVTQDCMVAGLCLDAEGNALEPYDYGFKDLYLRVDSIKSSREIQNTQRFMGQNLATLKVNTDKPAGSRICLKSRGLERVPSLFESYLGYGIEIATLWGVELATGGRLINMAASGFLGSLPHYGMLQVQLFSNQDRRKALETHHDYSPAESACWQAASNLVLFTPFLFTPAPDAKALTTFAGFKTFWLSALASDVLDCVDQQVVVPITEVLNPSNHGLRSEPNQLISTAVNGPGLLFMLLGSVKTVPGSATSAMVTKFTIKSAYHAHKLVVDLHKLQKIPYPKALQFIEEGVVILALQSIEEPGKVVCIFYDEHVKQVSADLQSVLPYAPPSQNDGNYDGNYGSLQYAAHTFAVFLLGSGISVGVMYCYGPSPPGLLLSVGKGISMGFIIQSFSQHVLKPTFATIADYLAFFSNPDSWGKALSRSGQMVRLYWEPESP